MMNSRTSLFMVICMACCAGVLAQAQGREGRQGRGEGREGRGGGRGGQETVQVATDKVTQEVPGIVKAGTKIEIIATGLRGSDAGVGLADGSFISTGNAAGLKD